MVAQVRLCSALLLLTIHISLVLARQDYASTDKGHSILDNTTIAKTDTEGKSNNDSQTVQKYDNYDNYYYRPEPEYPIAVLIIAGVIGSGSFLICCFGMCFLCFRRPKESRGYVCGSHIPAAQGSSVVVQHFIGSQNVGHPPPHQNVADIPPPYDTQRAQQSQQLYPPIKEQSQQVSITELTQLPTTTQGSQYPPAAPQQQFQKNSGTLEYYNPQATPSQHDKY